ncbi:hypothetical protein DL98DRAFT_654413 [Cadophora sp. DSE1049]|nr:hypothetical protein DL98DRAFT_654413 [Cadophora sp. DSE1049]
MVGLYSDQPIPVTLLVYRESHDTSSKVYTRSFSMLGALPQTYFSFEFDTVYLDWNSFEDYLNDEEVLQLLSYLGSDELAKAQNLALCEAMVSYKADFELHLCLILAEFGHVKKVTIVVQKFVDSGLPASMYCQQAATQMVFVDPIDIVVDSTCSSTLNVILIIRHMNCQSCDNLGMSCTSGWKRNGQVTCLGDQSLNTKSRHPQQ